MVHQLYSNKPCRDAATLEGTGCTAMPIAHRRIHPASPGPLGPRRVYGLLHTHRDYQHQDPEVHPQPCRLRGSHLPSTFLAPSGRSLSHQTSSTVMIAIRVTRSKHTTAFSPPQSTANAWKIGDDAAHAEASTDRLEEVPSRVRPGRMPHAGLRTWRCRR